ncbi:MAG: cyclase family protein [Anaerolineae bacterium]|nr:cyclase family protein [Anaerolineae bacterium]MCI0607940.1 cyclase family protein [Anaerolineae bacterium]
MCVPGTREAVLKQLSRRDFLKATAALMAGAMLPAPVVAASASRSEEVELAGVIGQRFKRAVDLTHVITEDFPTYFGTQNLDIETLFTFDPNGFNMYRWHLVEHTGTHMDAPFHFSPDGMSADQLPLSMLIVPLVVVDIREKAEENPDAQLTLEDLRRWERRHGRIPKDACMAMNSGWSDKVNTPEFRNADSNGVMHFPGFHVEAVEFLLEERRVNGIAVDTLSLDYGPSADFATHYRWLPTNRWGMEAVANLDALPPRGATLIVGSPKIAGCTGGISRLIALVPGGNGDD